MFPWRRRHERDLAETSAAPPHVSTTNTTAAPSPADQRLAHSPPTYPPPPVPPQLHTRPTPHPNTNPPPHVVHGGLGRGRAYPGFFAANPSADPASKDTGVVPVPPPPRSSYGKPTTTTTTNNNNYSGSSSSNESARQAMYGMPPAPADLYDHTTHTANTNTATTANTAATLSTNSSSADTNQDSYPFNRDATYYAGPSPFDNTDVAASAINHAAAAGQDHDAYVDPVLLNHPSAMEDISRRATESTIAPPPIPLLAGIPNTPRRRAVSDAVPNSMNNTQPYSGGLPPSGQIRAPVAISGATSSSAASYAPSNTGSSSTAPGSVRTGVLGRRVPRAGRADRSLMHVPPSPGSTSPWDASHGRHHSNTSRDSGYGSKVDEFFGTPDGDAYRGPVSRTGFNARKSPKTQATLGDPLEDAIMKLLVSTRAIDEIVTIQVALTSAGNPRRNNQEEISERKASLAVDALALARKQSFARSRTEIEDFFEALTLAEHHALPESSGPGSALSGGGRHSDATVPDDRGLDRSAEHSVKSEESIIEKTARLIPRAEWIAEEIRTQAGGLFPGEIDAFAAMLALLAEKSSTTIAAMTIVYNLQSPGASKVAKGEAAVVWRSDARPEKTVKQFIRVCEKLSAAADCITREGNHVEVVANAYELASGHENARYTLAVLIALMGVMMRCNSSSRRKVWLQPVDIHAATPTACAREWDPNVGAVILSIKGPWPWGDVVRTSVSTMEREELALTLSEGELPVLDRLEEQASELLEQKKEKHVFLLGETGVGKSTLGNILIGSEIFFVDAYKTGTIFPQPHVTNWGTERQVIWDTPGLNDSKNRDPLFLKEIALIVDRVQLAAAVVLVVRSAARIPHSLITALERYIDLFGPQLNSVLYIVLNDSSRVYPPDEIEMYGYTVAEQLSDELGLHLEPGFLIQIPTGTHQLAPDVKQLQSYNTQWLRQAVLQSRPVLTRMGHQTIESLLVLRTTLDSKQQQYYRRQLLEQSGRQREGLQLLLSRADVRKAFFTKSGYVLIQTWDLSRTSRILQVLQQQDSRMQQKREIRITPDNTSLGKEIAHALCLRKTHYNSRKQVRATTPENIFAVLAELGLVLIPLTVPTLADSDSTGPEGYAAARPGDKVSQRTLKAIVDVLADTNTADGVVRLVQSCLEENSSDITI